MSAFGRLLTEDVSITLATGGLMIGLVFGWVVYRTDFCTMGSISDFMSFGDFRRFRAWILAGAIAVIGAQLLGAAGAVDLSRSMYLTANLNWLGNILGGLMFGFGMVLAGGCASKNLVRLGGGDLRSLVTLLVLGLFAYMAIGGLIGPVRDWIERTTAIGLADLKIQTQSVSTLADRYLGMGAVRANLVVALLVAGAALAYCLSDGSFRASPRHVWSGIGVGLCVVAGWALTGFAFDELADKPTAPISLTYVRPTGDTIEWLQRFTAARMPGFGVATVLGAILGAFMAAASAGKFQVRTFAGVQDTLRNLTGAALMGVGGVMALGCTIGQGVTGISSLALGSFIAFAAIVVGGIGGIKYMERLLAAEV
jgi:hypothetical protein